MGIPGRSKIPSIYSIILNQTAERDFFYLANEMMIDRHCGYSKNGSALDDFSTKLASGLTELRLFSVIVLLSILENCSTLCVQKCTNIALNPTFAHVHANSDDLPLWACRANFCIQVPCKYVISLFLRTASAHFCTCACKFVGLALLGVSCKFLYTSIVCICQIIVFAHSFCAFWHMCSQTRWPCFFRRIMLVLVYKCRVYILYHCFCALLLRILAHVLPNSLALPFMANHASSCIQVSYVYLISLFLRTASARFGTCASKLVGLAFLGVSCLFLYTSVVFICMIQGAPV